MDAVSSGPAWARCASAHRPIRRSTWLVPPSRPCAPSVSPVHAASRRGRAPAHECPGRAAPPL
eukprot:4751706-Prymnesium_polylepis.3